jgi:hypothetical protein
MEFCLVSTLSILDRPSDRVPSLNPKPDTPISLRQRIFPCLVVNAHLSEQCCIGCLRYRPLPQLAVKGRDHLSLAMCRACNVRRGRERMNLFSSGVVIIESDKIARVEIDQTISRSRASLMRLVLSLPPLRCLRCARNARVNLGLAKNAFNGAGWAGTILAISLPRSVTFTSPADARRTHSPVAR